MNRCIRGSLSSMLRKAALLILVVSGIFISACEKRPASPPPPQQQYLFHTITFPGETLGIIAAWYTGTVQNWMLIRDANPELDPTRLQLGSVVRVPRRILVKDTPLPKSAVGGKAARAQDPSLDPNQPKVAVPAEQPTIIPPPDLMPEAEVTPAPVVEEFPPEQPEVQVPPVEEVPVQPTVAAEVPATKADEGRVKSRDELLKELLEDY